MPLVSILSQTACRTRAGISKMYITECQNVQDLVFDADQRITAIVMDGSQPDPTFKLVRFAKNTANFEQPKTVAENTAVNVAQTLNFNFKKLDAETRKALYFLNQECCIHAIVLDNAGQWWYFGISYYPETNVWESEDLGTGDGSANSGTNPTSDVAQFVESVTCNANFYAPVWTLAEAGIPVS